MARILNWLTRKSSDNSTSKHRSDSTREPAVKESSRRTRVRAPEFGRQPEFVDLESRRRGHIGSDNSENGPFMKSQYIREDSGTHETLTILNESIPSLSEDDGIDPYNTGQFDPSRYWDKTRK
jgi:hypothetical protein